MSLITYLGRNLLHGPRLDLMDNPVAERAELLQRQNCCNQSDLNNGAGNCNSQRNSITFFSLVSSDGDPALAIISPAKDMALFWLHLSPSSHAILASTVVNVHRAMGPNKILGQTDLSR